MSKKKKHYNTNMRYSWYEKGAFINKKTRNWLHQDFDREKITKIAVIRHAALGDQVITRPFLIEARKFFPNAHITLCAVSNYLYAMPDDLADSVHIMHGDDRKKEINLKEKIRNIKELSEQDIIFDLCACNRSYWMMLFSKAKIKIGFPYKTYLNKIFYDAGVFRSDLMPEVESMISMLKLLGHNPTYPLDFGYPDHRKLKDTDKPYLVYYGGGSTECKTYPFDKLAKLIDKAAVALPNFRHIYLDGLSDREKFSNLKPFLKTSSVEVQSNLDLNGLMRFLAGASGVTCTDTGIRNAAISTHTPTVGIFYSTVPFRYTPTYEKHLIAMNPDASLPSSDQVLDKIKDLVQ